MRKSAQEVLTLNRTTILLVVFRGGDSDCLEQNYMSCIRLPDYFVNVVQANEIMQIYLQLFCNERRLHSTKLNITNNLMCSLKYEINFIIKVIAPAGAITNKQNSN